MIAAVFAVAWLLPALLSLLDGRRPAVAWAAAAGMMLTCALLALLGLEVAAGGAAELVTGGWPQGIGIRLRADALSVTFALLTSLVLLAAVAQQAARGVASRSFPALAAFLQLGLIGLFLTGDAFNFYVFFEIAMIASFALASYGGGGEHARAAYTFAIVNLLGTVTFLAAVASLYHVTGTLDMELIRQRIPQVAPVAVLVIAASIFTAFGLKLGLFPFHFWLPPVYRDTTPPVAAILSGALANVGVYGLLRFGGDILPQALAEAGWLLLWVGGASAVYGGVLAVSRPVFAEVLAYSSISQAGYILLMIGLGGPVAFAAAVTYAIVNSLNKAMLFLAEDTRGALVPLSVGIGALSVAGIPPAAGLFAKAALFRAALGRDAAVVMIVVVVASAISILYMSRAFVRQVWVADVDVDGAGPSAPAVRAVVAVMAAVVLVLGIWPEPLLWISGEAAGAIERGTR